MVKYYIKNIKIIKIYNNSFYQEKIKFIIILSYLWPYKVYFKYSENFQALN